MIQPDLELMCHEMDEIARKYGYLLITEIELVTESNIATGQFHKTNYKRNINP